MFFGHNRHLIDPKGRIILPAKYRDELGDKFFITRGLDPCLLVYPETEWKAFEDKIRELPLSSGAKIQRFFFGNTDEASCDKQGRVLVSDTPRERSEKVRSDDRYPDAVQYAEVFEELRYADGNVTGEDLDIRNHDIYLFLKQVLK